jgi:hypothetical protein
MEFAQSQISWPESSRFAFTIFDDPDSQLYDETNLVYSFLADLGFRTTIGVWPLATRRERNSLGETCEDPKYRQLLLSLQARGFEIGFHNATPHDSTREETIEGLDTFERYFGHAPVCMANHYNVEAIYWGSARLSGWRRAVYNLITKGQNQGRFFGHIEGHRSFWGDVCQQRIQYCRNFVFSDINTLKMCPFMPYSDAKRAYVRGWYSASEGSKALTFLKTIAEGNQDQLEEEGGASIMYTHFGHGFVRNGKLDPEFRRLMERLAGKKAWFVPVTDLLNYLKTAHGGTTVLDEAKRRQLEASWLWEKLFRGTS